VRVHDCSCGACSDHRSEGQPLFGGAPDGAHGVPYPSQACSRLRVSVRFPSVDRSCARPVQGLVGAVAATSASGRPGPRVVGRSSTPDGIGRGIDRPDREFVARGDRSRICDSASGLRSRLRSVPATVRLLQRADPALGFVAASLRVLRGGVRHRASWSSALATRTLSQSVACRAASPCRARTSAPRASPSFFGTDSTFARHVRRSNRCARRIVCV